MTAQKSFKIIVTLLLTSIPFLSFANDNEEAQEGKEKFNATDMIMHHIGDSHSWHFFGEGESAAVLPLPVILYTDNGLVTFMSSEFHHDTQGHHIVEKDGMRFVNYHENIYQLNSGAEEVEFDAEHHVLNGTQPLDFSITKNVAAMFLTVVLMLVFFLSLSGHHKKNEHAPSGFNNSIGNIGIICKRRDCITKHWREKIYEVYAIFINGILLYLDH